MNLMLGPGLLDKMIQHATASLPNEACGLLVGHGMNATRFLRANNILGSPNSYEMDPSFLASTMRSLRESGESLVAIFHSHPAGPAEPSALDLNLAAYPRAAHVIVSLADQSHPKPRAFRIVDGQSFEIEILALG